MSAASPQSLQECLLTVLQKDFAASTGCAQLITPGQEVSTFRISGWWNIAQVPIVTNAAS
jgi:hypothetical protein